MAESLILFLCPCTHLSNKYRDTWASDGQTCLYIERIVSVYLFNHKRFAIRNIQPDPKRRLKVREGAIWVMGR